MPAMPRRLIVLLAALALTATLPTAATGSFDGYKESSRSTFTLVPEEDVVHATSTITVINQRKPTVGRGPCRNAPRRVCRVTTNYYIEGWGPIHVPPDAVGVSISGRYVTPAPIASDASGTTYIVRFPRLLYKKKQVINVSYDLPDAGPGATGRTRVTDAYGHFCWSGEYTDTGTVKAVLPVGWEADTSGAKTSSESSAASTVITVAKGKDLGKSELCTDAFRPDLMQRGHTVAPGGQLITFDGWLDDPDWGTNLTRLIEDELPALEETIGSPMPFASLTIREVGHTTTFGQPTDLDPATPGLLMDEDFDFVGAPVSALARTWFDDGSIADPWLSEGLVLWAGLSSTGSACPEPGVYPAEGSPDLHDWRVGNNAGADPMLPVYQVSAACSIVEDAADLIGPERMTRVIDSLRAGTPRYGDRTPDAQTPWQPADWTDWLDAVDELGMMPANQTDLELSQRTLTQYGIATSEELGSRFSARTLYHDTLDSMDGTALPTFVERLMEDWSFDAAVPAILEARRVYRAITDHSTLPDDMRTTFLRVFESAASPTALSTLEGAVGSWAPPAGSPPEGPVSSDPSPTEPASTDPTGTDA